MSDGECVFCNGTIKEYNFKGPPLCVCVACKNAAPGFKLQQVEVARLKEQRKNIFSLIRESVKHSAGLSIEPSQKDRFHEGGYAYLHELEMRVRLMIETGKTTLDEANAHARSTNEHWQDV